MKIEILCVFLLITCFEVTSQATLAISAAAAGTCTGSTYTFTLTGTLTGTTADDLTLTATTNPVTTATCTLAATNAQGSVTLSCSATSVTLDGNYVISALALPAGNTVLSENPTVSGATISSVKCPTSEVNEEGQGVASPTFTASGIGTGTCGNDGVYTFNVNGALSAATASAISITPTFTAPTSSPTCTCSLPITAQANIASAKIECKVTSALSSATITIGSMTGTGVTVGGLPQTMTGTATCAGKTDTGNEGGNNDSNANLIHLSKMLILAFFFLF